MFLSFEGDINILLFSSEAVIFFFADDGKESACFC